MDTISDSVAISSQAFVCDFKCACGLNGETRWATEEGFRPSARSIATADLHPFERSVERSRHSKWIACILPCSPQFLRNPNYF